jgi:hypothetical protein
LLFSLSNAVISRSFLESRFVHEPSAGSGGQFMLFSVCFVLLPGGFFTVRRLKNPHRYGILSQEVLGCLAG